MPELPPSTRGQALHRLGFAFKRPKKRLLKANEAEREAFVAKYAALWEEAQRTEARIFFADEAHFRADAELRGKWVLKGEPALVDSSSPRYGEKASYYPAVYLETGEVEWMELEGNSNAGTSETFLRQLRERHLGPLNVIWDNAPAPLRPTQEWRGVEGVPSDAMLGAAAGEPPSTRGQALPGHRARQGSGEGVPWCSPAPAGAA